MAKGNVGHRGVTDKVPQLISQKGVTEPSSLIALVPLHACVPLRYTLMVTLFGPKVSVGAEPV